MKKIIIGTFSVVALCALSLAYADDNSNQAKSDDTSASATSTQTTKSDQATPSGSEAGTAGVGENADMPKNDDMNNATTTTTTKKSTTKHKKHQDQMSGTAGSDTTTSEKSDQAIDSAMDKPSTVAPSANSAASNPSQSQSNSQ
jgi:hypothetical protein